MSGEFCQKIFPNPLKGLRVLFFCQFNELSIEFLNIQPTSLSWDEYQVASSSLHVPGSDFLKLKIFAQKLIKDTSL